MFRRVELKESESLRLAMVLKEDAACVCANHPSPYFPDRARYVSTLPWWLRATLTAHNHQIDKNTLPTF